MLCRACHVHVRRDFPYCLHCGTLRKGAKVAEYGAPVLRPVGQPEAAVAVTEAVLTIGRQTDNDLVIDEPSVSRHHARLERTDDGFVITDLDSFNGTTVGERVLHGQRVALTDGTLLHIGDVPVSFEQPRTVTIGSKTRVVPAQLTAALDNPQDTAPTATEPLSTVPRRRGGWALKQVPDKRGRETWVLRNTTTGAYLQLDSRDVFIWDHIDGQAQVRDLLFAYAQTYGELALPRIEKALAAFASIDLVRGLSGQDLPTRRSVWQHIGHRVLTVLMRMEVSVGGVDSRMDRLYQEGAWRAFTRTGVVLLWLLIVAGLWGFWRARAHQRLFDLGGAGLVGVVVVAVGYLAALTVHEATHALAVKSYGRRVTRGGFMLMMGMPFAFVDTSDMWFGTRWSRIVVTLSGPLSTAAVAGGFALVAAEVPSPVVAGVAFQLAFGLYLNTLYNFNPLMPLDGYQALADALRIPKLREEASAYASRGVWKDVAARKRPGVREVGLGAYGIAVVVSTYLFLVLGILAWRNRVGGLVHTHLHAPWDTLVVVVAIGLAMFPVWYRYGQKGVTLARRQRQVSSQRGGALAPASGADEQVPA